METEFISLQTFTPFVLNAYFVPDTAGSKLNGYATFLCRIQSTGLIDCHFVHSIIRLNS